MHIVYHRHADKLANTQTRDSTVCYYPGKAQRLREHGQCVD